MKETLTPVSKCPICGHRFDRCSDVSEKDQRGPQEGDYSLCIKCGSIGIFNKDLTVRAATPEEKAKGVDIDRLIEAQILIRGLRPTHDRRRRD